WLDREVRVDAVTEHAMTGERDNLVAAVRFELAVTSVELFALRALDNEETIALNGEVERIRAELDRTRGEVGGDFRHLGAKTDLAGIRTAAAGGRGRTNTLRLQELRREVD